MLKQYRNPHPTREPGSNKIVPDEEFQSDLKGYHPELQYSQLQPRDIDPDTIVRKSEGELMKTFEAKSLLSAAMDQLAVDQLRREEGEENAMRMRQIATDTHLPFGVVTHHVHEQATAPVHAGLVRSLHAQSDAHHAGQSQAAHAATLGGLAAQTAHVAKTESMRSAVASLARPSEVGTRSVSSDASIPDALSNHSGSGSMRIVGTGRGDPDDPTRMVVHSSGSEAPGALPEPARVPHLSMQDVGRPAAAIDPPAAVQHDTRVIDPEMSDEQAQDEMINHYDAAAERGEPLLLEPGRREAFVNYVRGWSRSGSAQTGPAHTAWMESVPLMAAVLGTRTIIANPMTAAWSRSALGSARDAGQTLVGAAGSAVGSASTMIVPAAEAVAGGVVDTVAASARTAGRVGLHVANVIRENPRGALNTVMGAGLGMQALDTTINPGADSVILGVTVAGALLNAAEYVRDAYRYRQQGPPMYMDPAAAVAGGTGYAFASPDAPGAAPRGSISANQYLDYMHAAGGADSGAAAQHAIAQGIRDTDAQGSASLPVRPAAFPLTNATVGQMPSSSGPAAPMTTEMGQAGADAAAQLLAGDRRSRLSGDLGSRHAASVPEPRGMTREQQRAQGMAALQRSREGLDSREAKLRTDGRQGRRQ